MNYKHNLMNTDKTRKWEIMTDIEVENIKRELELNGFAVVVKLLFLKTK